MLLIFREGSFSEVSRTGKPDSYFSFQAEPARHSLATGSGVAPTAELLQNLIMNPVIHSKRLTLAPFDSSDADIAIEMFTNPDVVRFAGGVLDELKVFSRMSDWTKRGGNGCIGIWCISDRESGEKLGTVALLPMPIEEKNTDFSLVKKGQMPDGEVEIGYFLKQSAWGNGYATEACKRLLQAVFEESPLTEVVATFDEGNNASRNVLIKAGFNDLGPRFSYGENGPYYRITRDEWVQIMGS